MIVCMYVICVHEIDVFLFCHLCICTFPFCVLCVCLCMLVCACVCERFWEVHPSERGVSFNCVEVLEGGWCRPHDSSVLFYPPLVCDCRSWTIAALGRLPLLDDCRSWVPRRFLAFPCVAQVAFADLKDDMDLAEDYLKYLVAYALAHCQASDNINQCNE